MTDQLHPTYDKILDRAESLFANKGFYGASLNDVAKEIGLSKQAVLHHFKTKEKLYAAVLERAAAYLIQVIDQAAAESANPQEQLLTILAAYSVDNEKLFRVTRLFIREMLDNIERAEQARQWFLAPLLAKMESIIIHGQEQGLFTPVHPMAFIYQILGGQQYFLISLPTIKQIHTPEKYQAHLDHHLKETERILEQTLFIR